ncbi:MAG: division/cell wall cluster transcriptional repressor MraZ [Lachnospiraceae bacterium]|nr:division/cell wall cluster transcriptional repressor MraZ [Lachnospiraceae bacterium]
MAGLIGEYNHTIDAKGRLSVPSKFRTVLGDSFVISKGIDQCLIVYSEEEWSTFQAKLNTLPTFDPDAREVKRFFGSGSAYVEVDSHGRILVPANLQEYAGLTKDVTIIGTTDGRAEIWDTANWNEREGRTSPKDAVKSLFSRGISI